MKIKWMVVCLLLSCSVLAQKHSTTIVVKNDSITFNTIVKVLHLESYIIDEKDSANGFIATKERALPNDPSVSVIFKFLIQPHGVRITGEAANNVTINLTYAKQERTFVNIYNGGMKKSPVKNAWNEMDRLAHYFGSDISYW